MRPALRGCKVAVLFHDCENLGENRAGYRAARFSAQVRLRSCFTRPATLSTALMAVRGHCLRRNVPKAIRRVGQQQPLENTRGQVEPFLGRWTTRYCPPERQGKSERGSQQRPCHIPGLEVTHRQYRRTDLQPQQIKTAPEPPTRRDRGHPT